MRVLALVALVLGVGCNMTKFTANTTSKVIKVASNALNQESDPELARAAAPASLKTIEGFLLAAPDNEIYLHTLAKGYCEYAFGFLDNDAEELRFAGKDDEADHLAKRATNLYLRCLNYGLKLMPDPEGWEKALWNDDLPTFEGRLAKTDEDHVPGMFFMALGLASSINLNRDDIDMIAYLPRAEMMFERVVKLDERYHNASAHMALGMLKTTQSKSLGGKPEEGLKHFERAIELTGGKYLMPMVLMARNYGIGTNNRKFFHDTLVKVLQTDPAIWPDQRLANELAHIRARRYLSYEKELF
jgi:hypothetical protein